MSIRDAYSRLDKTIRTRRVPPVSFSKSDEVRDEFRHAAKKRTGRPSGLTKKEKASR